MRGKSLQTTLYQAVHGNKLSVDELADRIGIGPSSLYRAVLEGDSGCKFDVQWLLPLMEATGDFAPLDLLCHRSNSVRVRLPRAKRWKSLDPKAAVELQQSFADLMTLLLAFLSSRDDEKREELETDVHGLVAELLGLRKALATFEQLELIDE